MSEDSASQAGFSPIDPNTPLWECYDCGAVVHDWELHRDWHRPQMRRNSPFPELPNSILRMATDQKGIKPA